MHTPRELVRARLDFVRQELHGVLGHVDQSMVDWTPAEGVRTIGGQLMEIAGSEFQVIEMMRSGRFVSDDEIRASIDCGSLESLSQYLNAVRAETLGYLDGLSDAELAEEVGIGPWHESIGLDQLPRAEILRGIGQHEAYHTGQLISYLWIKGDNPYRW